mgnify:CR=1 FL=1
MRQRFPSTRDRSFFQKSSHPAMLRGQAAHANQISLNLPVEPSVRTGRGDREKRRSASSVSGSGKAALTVCFSTTAYARRQLHQVEVRFERAGESRLMLWDSLSIFLPGGLKPSAVASAVHALFTVSDGARNDRLGDRFDQFPAGLGLPPIDFWQPAIRRPFRDHAEGAGHSSGKDPRVPRRNGSFSPSA